MRVHGLKLNRLSGWLLAIALVLPSLIGWLPMPMRAQAAVAATVETAHDAAQRLLADLAVLCTPYGLRLTGQDEPPEKPAGQPAADICILCGLAAGASLGVFQGVVQFPAPGDAPVLVKAAVPAPAPERNLDPRPPSRGPPN